MTADRIYERRWAMTLLQQVVDRLRAEMTEAGKAEVYEVLKECLTAGKSSVPYGELGERLEREFPKSTEAKAWAEIR